MMVVILIVIVLLFISVIFNLALAMTILRLKRRKESEKPDTRRHLDLLYAATACVDATGSLLCYPTLIYFYKQSEMNGDLVCTILGSFAVLYMTVVAVLTTTINIHIIYSCIKPLRFYVYLKTRSSKIPFLCIVSSIVMGVISLTITAFGHPRFALKTSRLYSFGCEADFQSPAMYYYAIVVYQTLGINVVTLVTLFYTTIKRASIKLSRTRPSAFCCLTLPTGVPFKIAHALLYLLCWAPFVVSS